MNFHSCFALQIHASFHDNIVSLSHPLCRTLSISHSLLPRSSFLMFPWPSPNESFSYPANTGLWTPPLLSFPRLIELIPRRVTYQHRIMDSDKTYIKGRGRMHRVFLHFHHEIQMEFAVSQICPDWFVWHEWCLQSSNRTLRKTLENKRFLVLI